MDKMQEKSDAHLLLEYAENGSEAAFTEIVARYTDLVYSSAMRQVGSPDLARDVAQSVFSDLARKAGSLARKMIESDRLMGWLYRSTRYEVLPILRSERRRLTRERLVMRDLNSTSEPLPDWDRIRPLLDEAMASLGDPDRDALLLRYFENEDLRSVGVALGISDDAAQKRVKRALEKLQIYLVRRGVTTTAAAVSTVLSANAVRMAPAGLAATLASASLAGAKIGTVSTLTLLKFMTMTKAKLAVTSAILAAGIATPIILQQKTNAKLRLELNGLRQQTQELAKFRDENQRLVRLKAEGDAREQNLAQTIRELQTLQSAPKPNPAVLDGTKSEGANETPNSPLVPMASWANVGFGTWGETIQSYFWATSKRDSNAFANAVLWDPAGRARLERLLAAAPDSVRQRFTSVDEILYDWWFNDQATSSFAAYRLVSSKVYGDNVSAIVELQDKHNGPSRSIDLLLHRDNDGWRVVYAGDRIIDLEGYLQRVSSPSRANADD